MYKFGPFLFDCRHKRLYRGGQRVQLTTKAMNLLEVLLEERPEVVTKEALIRQLWPEGVGTDSNLTVNVSALRKALGERSGENEYVVTVPTRGYSFAAQVVDLEADELPSESGSNLELHLAVAPPRVAGLEAGEAYLAHGIADALITELAQQAQLAVRPLSAVLDPRVSSLDTKALARSLKVALILTGSLERRDEALRLRLELLQPEEGVVLWAQEFGGAEEEIPCMAEEVGSHLIKVLGLPTNPLELQLPRPPREPAAFHSYLQGRHHLYIATPDSIPLAIELFKEAAGTEGGTNPRALASLALAYHYLVYFGMAEPLEGFGKAEEVLHRALEQDDTSSLAHAAMGQTRRLLHWDWEGAERELHKAVELGPLDSMCHEQLGYYLVCAGDPGSALRSFRRALDLDPSSLQLLAGCSWAQRVQGSYEAARELADHVLRIDPKNLIGNYVHGCSLLAQDRNQEALDALLEYGPTPFLDPLIGQAQAGLGNEQEFQKTLERIRRTSGSQANIHMNQATALAAHHDQEKCLDHLEEAARLRSGFVTTCYSDSLWTHVRKHPRFLALLAKIYPAASARMA